MFQKLEGLKNEKDKIRRIKKLGLQNQKVSKIRRVHKIRNLKLRLKN
jgi:hypothetical protein